MPASNAMIIEKIAEQHASIAVLQDQMKNLKIATDRNNDALTGNAGGYSGLISEVTDLSRNMTSMMLAIEEIKTSVKLIEAANPCKTCGIDTISEDLTEIKKINTEFPNILWLIRYKPKQTIPWIIITIMAVSSLSHIEFEPTFTAIMVALGVSPVIVQSIIKVFGK